VGGAASVAGGGELFLFDLRSRLLESRDIAYNESLKKFKAGRPGDLPCNKTVPLDFVMINVMASAPPKLQPIFT
jgi:hypothetical protein